MRNKRKEQAHRRTVLFSGLDTRGFPKSGRVEQGIQSKENDGLVTSVSSITGLVIKSIELCKFRMKELVSRDKS